MKELEVRPGVQRRDRSRLEEVEGVLYGGEGEGRVNIFFCLLYFLYVFLLDKTRVGDCRGGVGGAWAGLRGPLV